jgi:hypothetical protein
MEFGKAYCQDLPRGSKEIYFVVFYILFYFYEFWNLQQISGNFKPKMNLENGVTVLGHYPAQGSAMSAQPSGERLPSAHGGVAEAGSLSEPGR